MSRHARTRASRGGRARAALVTLCTLLAAGAGAVFSGVLPAPPGLPKSLVVAGDPAASSAVAVRTAHRGGTPGPAGAPGPAASGAGQPPTGGTTPSAGGLTPGATASGTPSATTTALPAAPPPATSGPGAPGDAASGAAATVLALVNAQRAQHGCGALAASPQLAALATSFSEEMATEGFFGHTDPHGRTPWQRAAAAGITNLGGENIARGQPTPQAVMAAWMHSPGHRANILDCAYHSLGVGVAYGTGGPWWTQDFGF